VRTADAIETRLATAELCGPRRPQPPRGDCGAV